LDTALASMDPTAASTATAMQLIAQKFLDAGYNADQIAGRLPQVTDQFRSMAQAAGVASISNEEMVDWMSTGMPPAAVAAGQALAQLGYAHVSAGASAAEQEAALRSLLDATQSYAAAAMGADGAAISYAQALDRATAAAEVGGIVIDEATGKIDVHTEAGQAASASLINLADSHAKAAQAALEDGASMQEVTAMTQTARDEFVAIATQMGLTGEQAEALADRYGLIPGQVVTDVSTTGTDASQAQIDAVKAKIDELPPELQTMIRSAWDGAAYSVAQASIADLPPETQAMIMSAWSSGGYDSAVASLAALPPEQQAMIKSAWDAAGVNAAIAALASVQDKTVTVTTVYQSAFSADNRAAYNLGTSAGRASGGPIFGPGTATSDSIPAWLSNGEFVVRTAAAERLGYGVLDYINRWGQLPQQGYASGGQVAPLSRQLVQSAAPVINLAMPSADDIARATSGRPVQLAVFLDSRQIAASTRAYNRGLT
ncbi:MAG: hypothetical protein GX875_00880, partial [Propionibacterium sp.]|nr:hypothetical protein [Propionibacterium sp.]